MSAVDPDTERGLYHKYDVRRVNDPEGKHDECWYFVLDPHHDEHARNALAAYIDSCEDEYPGLASDLRRNLEAEYPLGVEPSDEEAAPRDLTGAIDVGSGHYLRPGDEELWWSHPECRGWHPLSDHGVELGPEGVTIHGSLLCPDTGVHGWITNGKWVSA